MAPAAPVWPGFPGSHIGSLRLQLFAVCIYGSGRSEHSLCPAHPDVQPPAGYVAILFPPDGHGADHVPQPERRAPVAGDLRDAGAGAGRCADAGLHRHFHAAGGLATSPGLLEHCTGAVLHTWLLAAIRPPLFHADSPGYCHGQRRVQPEHYGRQGSPKPQPPG